MSLSSKSNVVSKMSINFPVAAWKHQQADGKIDNNTA